MKFDFVKNNFQNQIEDKEFDEYFKFLIQIIDYEFIRETQSQYNNLSNNEIYKLINEDKKADIIVSNKHVQIIIQNYNFDYIFYKNNFIINNSNLKTKSINEIIDQYLLDDQKQ